MNNYKNLYKNDIDKYINNNREYCFLKNIGNKSDIEDFFVKIDKIHKYKYLIKTNNKTYNTYLIGKTNKYLVTFNEEKIPFHEIETIEIIK